VSYVEVEYRMSERHACRLLGLGRSTYRYRGRKVERDLVFEEHETGRTQEFVLRWSPTGDSSLKEIVRQQRNFSPPESTREVEEYRVDLSNVTVLELITKPDIGGEDARASQKNLCLS
jgi:hypothetical protein